MNEITSKLEKLKIYTLQEIESFDLKLSKKAYLGLFYRKDNTLYVFEKLTNEKDSYLLKAIFED